MGRKIPGKKHHGTKDPAVQKQRREFLLKDKVNAPPTKADYQETPKSVLEIGRLKELAKNSKRSFKPKKKKKRGKNREPLLDTGKLGVAGPKLPGMKQQDKNLPRLQQHPGESEGKFLQRIESATADLINEVQMEAHHNVVIRRDKSGEVVKVEKGKKKLDEATKRKIRKSVEDFHSGKSSDDPKKTTWKERKEMKKIKSIKYRQDTSQGGSQKKRLGKKQRMKLKQAPKKIEKELEGIEKRYERVEFGEIVHEPPHIKKRPRGVDATSKPSVDGLLLTKMLNPVKDKDAVSMAAKERLEQQRLDVVQAYRALKASRRSKPT